MQTCCDVSTACCCEPLPDPLDDPLGEFELALGKHEVILRINNRITKCIRV